MLIIKLLYAKEVSPKCLGTDFILDSHLYGLADSNKTKQVLPRILWNTAKHDSPAIKRQVEKYLANIDWEKYVLNTHDK